MLDAHRNNRGANPIMRVTAGLLCGLTLLTAACSSTPGPDVIASHLNDRLNVRLAPDIAAGRAVLEPLPDGARVTLSEAALFPSGAAQMDDKGRYVVARVIEGMVDPRLLQVDIGGPRQAQAQTVADFFTEYLAGAYPQSHFASAEQPGATGVAITMHAAAP